MLKTGKTNQSQFWKIYVVLIVFSSFMTILFVDFPFFWDATSKSVRANWFYSHNFSQWVLPTEINSGHPPLWPILLALSWKIGGKTLLTSRLLMLAVNLLMYAQLLKFAQHFFKTRSLYVVVFLLILQPTLLSTTTIMNNDILLLAFLLLAFNAIYARKYGFLIIALTGLLFTNLRGIPLFLSILIIDFLFAKRCKSNFKIWPYFIPIFAYLVFLAYQYQTLGWVLFTPSENWQDQRQMADIWQILKNILVVGFNFNLFGMSFVWLTIIFLLFRVKKKFLISNSFYFLVLCFFIPTLLLLGFVIPFTNPIGVRYFIISYLILICFVVYGAQKYFSKPQQLFSYLLLTIGFITGHFWIFPSTISQPWDASLAYIPYPKLETQMLNFIQENQLPIQDIETNIPINFRNYAYLNDHEIYDFPEIDFSHSYILWSNIENKTSDEDQLKIMHQKKVKEFKKRGVFITLYQINQNTTDYEN